MANPLLTQWETPYKTPPFDLIETGHFAPAINEILVSSIEEINRIAENPEPPSFENTIAALDFCNKDLGRISSILFNLNLAETDKELQAVASEISPALTRFSNDITLNKKLFGRIKTFYESGDKSNLNTEQMMLLEKKFRSFILGGAGLTPENEERFRKISEELAGLTLKFEENVLDETNAWELHLTDVQDLTGLPDSAIEMASIEAGNKGKEGWIFTLKQPSYGPFMQYSERRELREKLLKAYNSRSFHSDEKDNRSLVLRIANLRLETAKLLGFINYAEMVLGDRMAENPANVNTFLERLFSFSHKAALNDFKALTDFAVERGYSGSIERWDWPFYSEKLRKIKYDFDDEILRPYFSLEKVREAIFGLAAQLYGLSFRQNTQISVYHSEVSAWKVLHGDRGILAVLYLDFHPRKGKSGGAWMTSFRDQRIENGIRVIPLISIVTNFSRPTETKPSLLTFNELITFLHEFGHALHGMLSECTFESLAGTNVARDFVELPSQFMQNWAFEEEWLKTWAVHYVTGEEIPAGIIKKVRESSTFNEGFACNRQLGFGLLDMAWHTITEPLDCDINDFETSAISKTNLFPKVESTNMSCSFTHLFGGDYAAGYYGYKWAEVLDADAFKYFRESGVFNSVVAESFRKNILEKGGGDKPMNLYIRFRGKEPTFDAFLDRSGLK